jgi:hypothetical protein
MSLDECINLAHSIDTLGDPGREKPTAARALEIIKACQKRTPHTWLTGEAAVRVLEEHLKA